jgi:hypothetical protein
MAITKAQIKKEILRSGKDPVFFITSYVKASHPVKGVVPFDLYDFQQDLVSDLQKNRFNIILKARQLGATTTIAAFILWMMNFNRDKEILVVATKLATAAGMVKKVRKMYARMPEWMKIAKIKTDNVNAFELSNGSIVKASSTSSDAGRSEALSLLVIDEAAFVDGMDEMWAAIYPTLSTGGRCVALSTPNGAAGWYYKIYTEAEEEKNAFNPIKLTWDMHPDRDLEWFKKETKNMSRREIAQELLCNFNMSGETVFDSDDIARLEEGVKDPLYRRGYDRNLWIWEEHNIKNTYLLVADVSRGDAADYSAFHVFNAATMDVVAEYQGKMTIDLYARLLYETGRDYGFCLMVVENNNIGYSVLEKLIDAEYPSLYWMYKGGGHVEQYIAEYDERAIPGFTVTSKSRPLIVSKLEEFVRIKKFITPSRRMINEMKTFIWKDGKPQAMRRRHDDLIMSAATACWIKDTVMSTSKHSSEYKKAFINSMVYVNTSFDTGMKKRQQTTGNQFSDVFKTKKQQNTKQDYIDYAWILKG